MKIVDANVLLYAVNAADPKHHRSRQWLDEALNGQAPVGFAWLVLTAFLRLSTNPGLFPRPLTLREACDTMRAWLAQPPSVVVGPTTRHADVLCALLSPLGTAANLVSDAHLAALAIEHDATVTTFDNDFGRFPGVRWEQPATV